ncbi:MAG: glycosyltransferase, partial [Verrucomicrobiota bacterium]
GGGVGRYINEKRAYIRESGVDEHVLLIPGEKTQVIREGVCQRIEIASPLINQTSRYRILWRLTKAEELLAAERPDIIESGDPYHLGWRVMETGKALGIPVVGFYHSHFPEAYMRTALKYGGPWVRDAVLDYAKNYIARLYNQFDATIVPSRELVDLLKEWGVGNAHFLHLGVDTKTFQPDAGKLERRQKLGLDPNRFWLMYAGRLAGEKNTRTLLEAFKQLEQRCPGEFGFLVIGDGALRPQLEAVKDQCHSFRWESYCRESSDLAEWYRASDLFVHPGIFETFGLVSLESQASGCPVVGIRGSKMDANIMVGLDLWADQNTPEALVEAILRMKKENLSQMGLEASRLVSDRYSWEVVFQSLWDLYAKVIEEKKT